MTHAELVEENIRKNYEKYKGYLPIPIEKLPRSGDFIETVLNTGEIELVDRISEFAMAKSSSVYFINRYCFTNNPVHGKLPFILHKFQYNILREYALHRKVIWLKSRQVGASAISGAYSLWTILFNKNLMAKVISMTRVDANEFLAKNVLMSYESIPGFLKSSIKGHPSKSKLELLNGSIINVLSNSPNAGRGSTPALLIADEIAFWNHAEDLAAAIEPAMQQGGQIIMLSTPNGSDPQQYYYVTWQKAINGLSEYYPIYFPWAYFPGRSNPWVDDLLDKKESGLMTQQDVDRFIKEKEIEQLSYEGPIQDAPYLVKMRAAAKSEIIFRQEILASFEGSNNTVIPFAAIKKVEETIIAPLTKDVMPETGEMIPGLWVWKVKNNNDPYIITADTATGHGGDSSTFHVVNQRTKEQEAEFKLNIIATDDFGRLIKKMAHYYNEAFVVIECNHPGPATFNEVYKSQDDPYSNMYIQYKGGQPWSWDTTEKSRVMLIDAFYKDVFNGNTIIHSERLLNEIKTFIWSESGKAQATNGSNDDLVMAYSFYCYLGNNETNVPLGLYNETSAVTYTIRPSTSEIDWYERERSIEDNYGVSLIDYYELQGWDIPNDYQKWNGENALRISQAYQEELGLSPAPGFVLRKEEA
jgi:hypothetical protein